ncbi:MAG: Gfo/Idh/MocA family protein [Armatimonadota bacterium]
MSSRVDRRTFLRNAARGGAGLVILSNSRSVSSAQANEKLNVALVGVGGRGGWFAKTMPKLSNVVALCDVNEQRAAEAFKAFPDLPKYHDYRKMLDEMDKQIDAIVVATPDHSHAGPCVRAMKMGKHVFVEKPLTHNVREARIMRETAAEHKVATQMGNQGTSSPAFRRALELIQGGVLGEIREAYVWKDGGGPGRRDLPSEAEAIPEHLKWDLWLGPAADRAYNQQWMRWHGWRDFGTGQLGNWATHTANLAFKSLKMDSLWYADPTDKLHITVEAEVSEIDRHSFPKWEKIHFQIPARGELPPVTLHYYNGGQGPGARAEIEERLGRPLDWGDHGEKKWNDHAATLILGTEGRLWANGHNTQFALMPADKFKGLDGPPESLPRSPGHEREWLNACGGGDPAWSNFNYATPLAEFLHLGNLSTQFHYPVEYDPVACKIVTSEEADAALRREPRKGWEL